MLQTVSQAIFLLVAVLALVDLLVHGGPRRRDVAAMLWSFAAAVLVRWWTTAGGPAPEWIAKAAGVLVVAQPYLLLRVVRHFRPVGRWTMPAALAGLLGSSAVLLASPQPTPPWGTITVVACFGLGEGWAAWLLVRGALGASGDARRRLGLAATGSCLLALLIALAGVAAAWPAAAAVVAPAAPVLVVASAAAYYLGFAPPAWVREYWRGLRLGGQVALLVVAVTLATALATAVLLGGQLRAGWTEQLYADQLGLAQLAAAATGQHLTGARAGIALLAQQSALRDAVAQEPWDVPRIEELLRDLQRQEPTFGLAFVLDANGVARANGGPDKSAIGRSFADREYYQGVRRTLAPYLANPYRAALSGVPTFSVAAPVFGRDGQLRAVVAASFDLDRLAGVLSVPGSTPGTQVAVVAPPGLIAVHPDPTRRATPVEEQSAAASEALGGASGVRVEAAAQGGDVLVAYAPVPDVGWAVLVSTPTAAIFGPLTGAAERGAALVLVLIVVLGAGTAVVARPLFRPLRVLSAAAARFGSGDYRVRVEPRGAADVRDLTAQFNAMAEAVAAQAAALAERGAEAERRAAQRQAFAEMAVAVAAATDAGGIARAVAADAVRLVPATACRVLLTTAAGDLEVVAAGGAGAEQRADDLVAAGSGIALRALRSGSPVLVAEGGRAPGDAPMQPAIRAELAVPIAHEGAVLGVVHFGSTGPTAFAAAEVEVARSVAAHAALALARVRLLGDLRRLTADLLDRTQELTAANGELEAFSYSVSHDLRAPLRAMDGYSRILLEEFAAGLDAEAREYLGGIRANAQRMGVLIDDLLAFARLGRQPVSRRPVAPAEVARQALRELRHEQDGRQVRVAVSELPACSADPAMLKQVYANLLSNALKYTRLREVAVVAVGSEERGGETVYFVRDNGAGFDMRYAGKLFGVFQRLHRSEEYEGTGVGLATVQRIVHRHGGRVWAEAEPDKGATFFFTLGGDGGG